MRKFVFSMSDLLLHGDGHVEVRVFTLFLEVAEMWVAVRLTVTSFSDRTCISGQVFDLITCHLALFSSKFLTVLLLIILFLTNWT